jgi:hypothetical protein
VSSVAKASSSVKIELHKGTNNVYIYAGKDFTLSDSIVAKKDAFDSTVLAGCFRKYYTNNNQFLTKPIFFNVDEANVVEKKPYPIIKIKSDKANKIEAAISSGGAAIYMP